MKYNPSKLYAINCDGEPRICYFSKSFYRANRNIFPTVGHGTWPLDQYGITRYGKDGRRPRVMRGGNYFMPVDQVHKALSALPDDFKFVAVDERGKRRRRSCRGDDGGSRNIQVLTLQRIEAIVERLDKLLLLWGSDSRAEVK